MSIAFPFFAIYLTRDRGIPVGVVGFFLSVAMAATAFSHGWGGELSDAYGRRRVMVVAMGLRAATVFLLALAISLEWDIAAVLLLHLGVIFFGNFFRPAARSWVADQFPPGERREAYSLLRVGVNMGWAFGPAAGGFLAARSYAWAFFVTGIASAACTVIVAVWIKDSRAPAGGGEFKTGGPLIAAGDRRFAEYCFYSLLISVVMAQMVAPLSIHAVEYGGLDETQVGLLFSVNGVLVVLLQQRVSRWLSRFKITAALVAGCVCYGVAYGLIGWVSGFGALACLMCFITLAEIIVSPGLEAMTANISPDGKMGRYSGLNGAVLQLGHAAGPLLGGLGLQYLSPRWPPGYWMLVGGVGMLAAGGFYSFRRRVSLLEEGI